MSRSSAQSRRDRRAPSRRGLLIGRFQPFHLGHLRALETIHRERPRESILLGIGSAQVSHTLENPFTAGERMEMVLRALEEAGLSGVLPIPLLDIDRHSLWVGYVVSLLPRFDRVYSNNPLTRALFEADGYEVVEVPWQDRVHLEGTAIRRELLAGDAWRTRVPGAVLRYLEEIDAAGRLRLLARAPRTPDIPRAP